MHLGGFHGGKRNATCRGRNHDVKEAEFGFPCFFRRGTGENTELGDILGAFLVPSSALHRSWGPRSAILLATSPRPDSTRGRGSNGNSRSPPFSLFRFCPRFRHGCPDARSRGACSRPGAATSRAIARSGARMHTSGSAPGPSGVAEVSPLLTRAPHTVRSSQVALHIGARPASRAAHGAAPVPAPGPPAARRGGGCPRPMASHGSGARATSHAARAGQVAQAAGRGLSGDPNETRTDVMPHSGHARWGRLGLETPPRPGLACRADRHHHRPGRAPSGPSTAPAPPLRSRVHQFRPFTRNHDRFHHPRPPRHQGTPKFGPPCPHGGHSVPRPAGL